MKSRGAEAALMIWKIMNSLAGSAAPRPSLCCDPRSRTKRLGVEISFLPDLLYLYGAAYRDQILGPDRTEFMEPMAACLKAGVAFSIHTDAPVSPVGPLRLMQIAVTRRCVIDKSVIGADQAITVEEALKAITIHAARQIGLEDSIGTIEPGKEADLTILESDPTHGEPGRDRRHQGQRDVGRRGAEVRGVMGRRGLI